MMAADTEVSVASDHVDDDASDVESLDTVSDAVIAVESEEEDNSSDDEFPDNVAEGSPADAPVQNVEQITPETYNQLRYSTVVVISLYWYWYRSLWL